MESLLKTIFNSIGQFNDEQLHMIDERLVMTEYKADDKLLKPGDICSSIHFVKSGSFYSYSMNEQIEKVIHSLATEGDVVLDAASFTTQKGTNHTIEAFADSCVFSLDIHNLHQLIEQSHSFFQIGKVLESSNAHYDPRSSPQQRYEQLLNHRPDFIRTFPLKYIASYLQITPETLSRIRKKISN